MRLHVFLSGRQINPLCLAGDQLAGVSPHQDPGQRSAAVVVAQCVNAASLKIIRLRATIPHGRSAAAAKLARRVLCSWRYVSSACARTSCQPGRKVSMVGDGMNDSAFLWGKICWRNASRTALILPRAEADVGSSDSATTG